MTETSTVTVEPWGITFDVRPDETLFDAAARHGWQWPTNCYGQCRCTVCHVRVIDGAEALGEPADAELAVLETLRRTVYQKEPDVILRLACQTRPHGDARVEQRRSPEPVRPAAATAVTGHDDEADSRSDSEVPHGQH